MRTAAIVLATGLTVSGCASKAVWQKPWAEPGEFEMVSYSCLQQANATVPPGAPPAPPSIHVHTFGAQSDLSRLPIDVARTAGGNSDRHYYRQQQVNRLFVACMRADGWTLVEK